MQNFWCYTHFTEASSHLPSTNAKKHTSYAPYPPGYRALAFNSFDELCLRSTHLDRYLHYLQFLCNVATHRYGLAGAARRFSIGKCNPSLCQSFVCVSSTLPNMSEVVARR